METSTGQGLNRTSVGLKLDRFGLGARGLGCLNRTSVGLKLCRRVLERDGPGMPQSNQRGIETFPGQPLHRPLHRLNRTSVGLKLWTC